MSPQSFPDQVESMQAQGAELAELRRRLRPFVSATTVVPLMVLLVGIALVTAQSDHPLGALGALLAIVTATFSLGSLVGLLFALPRDDRPASTQGGGVAPGGAAAGPGTSPGAAGFESAAQVRYSGNNNLLKVADWLTSAITGAALVSFVPLATRLWQYAGSIDLGLRPGTVGQVAVVAAVLVGLTAGFQFAYLACRVLLPATLWSAETSMRGAFDAITTRFDRETRVQLDISKGLFWMTMNGKVQGWFEKSLACFDNALRIDPTNTTVMLEKARAYKWRRAAGDLDEAVRILDSAIAIAPTRSSLRYNRACYRALRGDPVADWRVDVLDAVRLAPRTAGFLEQDEDFSAIRQDPSFVTLLADAKRLAT